MRFSGLIIAVMLAVIGTTVSAQVAPVLAQPDVSVGDIVLGGADPAFTGTILIGEDLAVDFDATDGDAGDTLTTDIDVTGGTLTGGQAGFNEVFPFAPAGSTGGAHSVSLTGTAAMAGTIELTITVDDGGGGGNDVYTLTITISAPPNNDPVLGAPNVTGDLVLGGTDPTFTATCTVGEDLAVSFQATDADGADTLTVTAQRTAGSLVSEAAAGFSGTFPATSVGVSPRTLLLSGTALAAGTITLTIDVDDGASGTDSYTLAITINAAANNAPVLAAPNVTGDLVLGGTDPTFTATCTVGDNLAVSFQATDADGGDTLTVTAQRTAGSLATEAAAGFSGTFPATAVGVSPRTVILTGTALAAGTITLTIDVDDGASGTDSYTLAITIAAAGTPTITVTGTLNPFTTTGVGVPSAEQSYTVSGANLTASITIDAPTHFQISTTSGAGFGAQVVLPQAGGTVNNTTIFARYNPASTGSHNGNITHDSTGATQRTQAVSGSIAGPAAVTMSVGSGNPGSQSVSPGSSATALVFRLTETGGGSTYTVTSVSADVTVLHPTPGVAIATIQSISLRRGSSTLGSITNGGAGWGVAGSVITVNFNALSSAINASTSADFRIVISFTGGTPPSPNPGFQAGITSTDVNSGASVSGGPVNGGTITLREDLPDDPFAEDDDDSCELAARGAPAWPLALFAMLAGFAALVRRRRVTE